MNDEDLKTVEAMAKYGGSFARQMAALCLYADKANLEKIKKAWPSYWESYRKLAESPDDREEE